MFYLISRGLFIFIPVEVQSITSIAVCMYVRTVCFGFVRLSQKPNKTLKENTVRPNLRRCRDDEQRDGIH